MIKRILVICCLLMLFSEGFASHLVGGNLGYEYLGQFGSNYRYKIVLTVYNNCDGSSLIPLPVATQPVSIYDHDVSATTPMSGNDKPFHADLTLILVDSNKVEPPVSSGCAVGQNVCIYKGVYEAEIDLPLSFNGYHLYFENFARNGAITNLFNPGGTAMAFHAYIPPTLVNNSSPVFSDDPVPFLCVNDTVSILNTAIDPDGDQLVFSFVTPMGAATTSSPANLSWPVTPVAYNGPYSTAQPFGAGGYTFINGATGLTQYMSPATGNYVVAVEIKEIRNGNVIGVTRRDLQLLVITCPPNPAPNLSNQGGSGQTQYTIKECDTLSFPVTFTDANGDSLFLSTSGQLFDTSFVNPAASIDSLVVGDSTVTATFNWVTSCGTAQALPYQFTVSTTDNGCPPKTTNVVYQITVEPPLPPDSIIGPPLVCENENATYCVDTINGYTFNWSVTNGTIVSGQGSTCVVVNWPTVGAGTVAVNGVSDCGCPSAIIDTAITIIPTPGADAGLDTNICLGDTIQIGGSPTAGPGTIISWSPNTNISDTSAANPLVWPSTTTSYIVTVDNGTCIKMDTVTITVGSALVGAGPDTAICVGDSAQLVATGGVSYAWTPNISITDTSIANPIVFPGTTTTYFVSVTDSLGCIGTDSAVVTIDTIPVVAMSNDTAICQGSCVTISASGGGTYAWTPSSTLNDTTLANPTACPTTTTTYYVTVGSATCSSMDSVTVTVNPPATIVTNNDTAVCDGNCVQLNTTGGISYQWSPSTGLSNDTIANPLACPLVTTTYIVTGIDTNGCIGTDTVTITINPLPTVDAGPDQSICGVGSVVIGGTPTGPVGSSYAWVPAASLNDSTLANPTASPTSTTTYTVTVTDTNGCQNSNVVTVMINSLPTVDAGMDTTICENETIQIGGAPTGPSGSSYLWTPSATLDNDTASNPNATPIVTTEYIVTVTDSNGCVGMDSVLITVNPLPTILTNNDTSVCIGTCAQLSASGATSYIWTPGATLNDSTIANPVACPTVTTTYTVTGTDANSCSDTASVTITIDPLPIVDAGPDVAVCIGDSVVIGGSPTGPAGSSYVWTPALTLDDDTLANPTAFPTSNTQYIVVVTDSNGCIASDTVDVTVNPLPVADAGLDTAICVGVTLQIGGTPTGPLGSSYTWAPSATLDDDTLSNPNATPVVTTEYIVTVTDSNGCMDMDSVLITVNPLPNVTSSPDTAMCIGACYQMAAAGASTYVWTPATGLNNDTIANPIACPTVTTNYIVTGTDTNGCVDTSATLVTINPLPTVTVSNDTSVCIGTCAQLIASGGTGYVWTPGSTLNDSTIFNPIACPTTTTNYLVTVTDANLCVDTASVTVTVDSLPTIDAGPDTALCIGDSIQLNATGGVSYVWTPSTAISDTSVANPVVFPTVTTTYYVIGTDSNGCENLDSVIVTVNPLPTIITSNDTAICLGDCAQLSASGGSSYVWTPGATLNDSTIFNPIACPTVNTTYLVTATDSNSCVDTATVNVTINPLPVINAGPDVWLCAGDSIQLNATGGVSYTWIPGSNLSDSTISNPWAFPIDTTNYIVTGVDSNGCSNTDTVQVIVNDEVPIDPGNDTTICFGDSIILGGNPTSPNGTSYQWFPNATLDNDTLANPTAFPSVTTTYYIVATNDTCTAIDSITITVNPPPPANAGSDVDICFGDTVQLSASGGIAYLWQPGSSLSDSTIFNPLAFPGDTTSYIVEVTDTNGCTAMDTVTVNVNPLPTISAGAGVSVCLGDSIQLNATGGVSYVWTPSAGLSNDTIANPMASPAGTTTYVVTGTDALGCSNTDSVTVTINQLNLPSLNDTTICIGESLQLTVNGPPGATYAWTPPTDLSDTSIFNPITTTQVTITYLVTVTDTNGCQDTASILVVAEAKPTADYSMDQTPSCDGMLVDFTNLSQGAVSYNWDFDDGTTSVEINPSHTFAYGSSYNVVLISYTNGLCSDTATYPVLSGQFEDYFNLVPPTVITPNGDGFNDLFRMDVPDNLSECVSIQVFNRWGMLIFESNGQNGGWDGRTTAGNEVPDGTYFYIIDINGAVKKGSLTLTR